MPRPGRAYWKGVLRLSLVSIPVEIFNAVDTASEIRLNQIHRPSGKRVNYTKTVAGIGPVESADIVKGYEVDKDVYVTIEPEEIDALKVESRRSLDLQRFVDAADIDWRFFEKPYYIVPADDAAAEGYLVIREALGEMNKLGLGQITLSGREHMVAIGPVDRGLVMEVLRYQNEIRTPDAYFAGLPAVTLDTEMVALAKELIARKAGAFDPAAFSDGYATAMRDLVARKAKGQRIVAPPPADARTGTVIDLLDALRSSLKTSGGAAREVAKPRRKPAKKPARSPARAAG